MSTRPEDSGSLTRRLRVRVPFEKMAFSNAVTRDVSDLDAPVRFLRARRAMALLSLDLRLGALDSANRFAQLAHETFAALLFTTAFCHVGVSLFLGWG